MLTGKPRRLGGFDSETAPTAPSPRSSSLAVDERAEEVCDAAIDTGRELTKIGDARVEQFVVEARVDGLSWTRIGELVGMRKRAAQKRYAVVSVLAGAWPGELADRFAGP